MSQSSSSASASASASGGVGFFGLMFLIFLTLKLTGVITWSWWWVTAPLWMPFGAVAGISIIIGLIFLLAGSSNSGSKKRSKKWR